MVIRLGKSSWDVFVEPPMGPPCLSGLGLVKSRTRAERGKEEIQTLAFLCADHLALPSRARSDF